MDYSAILKAYDLSELKEVKNFKFSPDRFRSLLEHSLDSLIAEKNGVQRPEYSGNMADVVDVSMNQQAVTRATDAKPVLATYGLGPCVALVGYESSTQVGFLTHYSASTEVNNSFPNLLATLYRIGLSHDASTRFEVRLVGGWKKEDKLIIELKTRVRHGTSFNMEIIEEDTGYVDDGRSVALDTKTGKLFSYDPTKNPNAKAPSELEIMRMLIPRPADLIYEPR